MATHKDKKHKKKKFRNAAMTSAKPRRRNAVRAGSASGDSSDGPLLDEKESRALQAAKIGAGMLAGTLACAYIAKQDWLPPKTVTGIATASGAALLLGSNNPTWRLVGAGAGAMAAGQLILLAADDQSAIKAPAKVASSDKPAQKKPANADGLPPGALEAAYERARRRLEMTYAPDAAA